MRSAEWLIAFVGFAAVAFLLQWRGGAYTNSFGLNSDEPAHFVTALMVRDVLAVPGSLLHPMAFAKDYYLHYPKIGLGQWPPFFYAVLGAWMYVFGGGRAPALAFQVVAASGTALLIYLSGRALLGRVCGAFAAVLFLASPLVQFSTGLVMTEHLVTLLIFASALQFARYAETGSLRDALGFGALATLAILTRGSGWALGLVPPLAIMLTGRWYLWRRVGLYASALPVIAFAIPWYALTTGGVTTSWVGTGSADPFWFTAGLAYSAVLFDALGAAVLVAAGLGAWAVLVRPRLGGGVHPVWAAIAAQAIATMLLQCSVPTGIASRFMVTMVPAAALLAAAGIAWVAAWVPPAMAAARPVLSAAIAAALLVSCFAIRPHPFLGYEPAARDLAAAPGSHPAVLVLSDEYGEGAMVAAFAAAEQRPGSFVLRGTKLLVKEDWLGRNPTERFSGPGELAALLERIPVSSILLDMSISPDASRPYHARLQALLEASPALWPVAARYAIQRGGDNRGGTLVLYRRAGVPGRAPDVALLGELVSAPLMR